MRPIATLLMPLTLIATIALGLSACDDNDDPVDPGNGNGGDDSIVVVLTGDVSGNRTLSADSISTWIRMNQSSSAPPWKFCCRARFPSATGPSGS